MDLRVLRHNARLLVGGAILALLLLVAVVAPGLVQHDPNTTDLSRALDRPSVTHPAGRDLYGRDLLARLIWGARRSLGLALGATAFAVLGGAVVGMLAGAGPRWADLLLSAAIDVLLIFPGFLLAMVIVAALGPGTAVLTLAIGLAHLPRVALVTRATALGVAALPHIDAARALGVPLRGILWRGVLPGVLPTICVIAGTVAGNAIIAEAGLSFLGIGVQPPEASWGTLIADAGGVLQSHPWVSLAPVFCVAAAVAAMNLLGDGLCDLLDPRRRSPIRSASRSTMR